MSHDAHGEKNDSIIKIALNMMMACLVSGSIIAGVYAFTEPAAINTREQTKQNAMKALVDDVSEFKPMTVKVERDGQTLEQEWFAAMKDGKQVAYIVPAEWKGYEGIIKMVAAIHMDGRVIKYQILSHRETPGLGDLALEPKFIAQFKDKSIEDLVVVKVPTEKNIQALTGATITTRAVTNGVKRAAEEVLAYEKTHKK